MFRRVDTISGVTALMLHASIAVAMLAVPPPPKRTSSTVEVDVQRMPPPPKIETPPEPLPPEPPPERKVVPKVKQAPPPEAAPPPPNKAPPKEPPPEVKPVFGVTMESTTDSDSSFSVPVGNTTMIDPKNSGKHTGAIPQLPAGTPGPSRPEYKPVAAIYVKTLPDIDVEACGRLVSYPAEAQALGIEGEVKLRVSLDETGKVHDIKVLSGLGHGLDEAAVFALKHKCKFKPAIGTDGKPVAYVIQTYTWNFVRD